MSGSTGAALLRLDELTRRLRAECPWDRAQDERSIVPHTVEEAYELADAAHAGDDARMLDELGDVLFQVYFLALLLEERGAGGLAEVADHCVEKLTRRHPHVFGEVEADDAETVRRNWDEIKRLQEGRGDELPDNLPSLLLARKVQRRAASRGFDFPDAEAAAASVREELAELLAATEREERFDETGDLLFAVTSLARKNEVDPELALRAASDRFTARLSAATRAAEQAGEDWNELPPERKAEHYAGASS